MIPPLHPYLRAIEASGVLGLEFSRWLQLIARTISSTYIADEFPNRSFAIEDGQWGIHVKRLTLTGSQRTTIKSDSRLVICG